LNLSILAIINPTSELHIAIPNVSAHEREEPCSLLGNGSLVGFRPRATRFDYQRGLPATSIDPPHAAEKAVDEQAAQLSAATSRHRQSLVLTQNAAAVVMGEQDVVVLRQKTRRSGRFRIRTRRIG
jgi:hypothetical protein